MKNTPSFSQSGNAFLYVLIAIALFAGLTLVLTRAQDGGENTQLDQGKIQVNAQRLVSYVDQAGQSWLRMQSTGTDLGELSLMLPTNGSFNTAPTLHKFFHPDGGGFLYRSMNETPFRKDATAPVGWFFVLVNVDWSETTGTDFLMTYINLTEDLCAKINDLVRGDSSIPTTTVNFNTTFNTGGTSFQEAQCAECKNYNSLCIESGGSYAFYNIIEMR